VERVSVVGNSGSGKTTLAAAIAAALDAPHLELDAVFHQPGWTELPVEVFRATVADVVTGERWVVDGNYTAVQDLVWARADTVVWLDYSRLLVMRQIVGRTLRRLVTRQRLWNGNREPWRNLLTTDPKRSIIAWAWTQHHTYRVRYGEAAAMHPEFTFVRLRSPAEADTLVGSLRSAGTAPPG
jgi:adenylate kinase family enzyme